MYEKIVISNKNNKKYLQKEVKRVIIKVYVNAKYKLSVLCLTEQRGVL